LQFPAVFASSQEVLNSAASSGLEVKLALVVVACGHPQADEMGDDSVVAR
jgi:hypothetical protein